MQIKGYYRLQHSRSLKVIEVGANRKPVCDFLLVINSNWHPISYCFGVIAAYCSNFGHCINGVVVFVCLSVSLSVCLFLSLLSAVSLWLINVYIILIFMFRVVCWMR